MNSWRSQVIDELRIFTWEERLETFVSSVAAQNWKEPDRKSEVDQFGVWSHLRRFKTVWWLASPRTCTPKRGGSPEDFLLCTGIECGGGSFRRCVQYERPVRCLREDFWTWWGLPNLAVLLVYYMLHLYALCTGVFKCVSFYFTHAAPLAYVVYSWNTFKLPNFLFILSLFWVRCSPMTIQHFVWLETAYPAYLKVVIHKGRYYHIFTWWIHREKRFQHSRSYEGSTNYP